MIKSFTQLVSNPLMNMGNVYRYSGAKVAEPESLAMHIVDVQMMGYMILQDLNNQYGENLDAGVFLEKALHHDLEESLTGDVCRTLKYYNPSVLKELQDVAKLTAADIYLKYFNDEDSRLFKIWDESKSGKEGFIVKIVDMLTVASKALREVELLNNMYFLKVVYEVKEYLGDVIHILETKEDTGFSEESIGYLLVLVKDADSQLARVWDRYKELSDHYYILDNTLMGGNNEV